MHSVPRAALRGPTFIRLLARLTAVEIDAPGGSLPDRLSRWLDWTHAIALSTALDGQPPGPDADAPAFDAEVEAECAQVRASLVRSIEGARELVAPAQATTKPTTPDVTPFRQRHLAIQRTIQAHTGQLRGRLRDMLARRSPAMARLAEVDAVMEMTLSPREHRLLGNLPAMMADHFDRLRRSADESGEAAPDAWLDRFRHDMRHVLLAELDVRFQPVEALLAALRTR